MVVGCGSLYEPQMQAHWVTWVGSHPQTHHMSTSPSSGCESATHTGACTCNLRRGQNDPSSNVKSRHVHSACACMLIAQCLLPCSSTSNNARPSLVSCAAALYSTAPSHHRLLGVAKEASFEEIQDARNYLFEVRLIFWVNFM